MASAGAGDTVTPPVADEFLRQQDIYRSRGANVPSGYVIDRSLLSYAFVLPTAFRSELGNLGPADRWLDIGAGEGRAILDYCTSRYDAMLPGKSKRKARSVAISIEDRRTHRWHHTAKRLEPDQISYLHGKRLREYAPEELGRFRLITDVMGGFSYAADLSLFIEKTLDVLATDGSFFTVLQDVRSEHRTNSPYYPDAPFLTEIVATDGTEITMCAWLKRIKCAEVSCEFKKDMQPPIEVYRIHKTCNETLVPKLTMVHFQAGTPPERRFRLVHSAPRADP